MSHRISIALAGVLLLAGCHSGVHIDGRVPAASGCGEAVPSGFYRGVLHHDGRQRSFNVYIPEGYHGRRPHPLLIAVHGGLGTGAIFAEQARLAPAADRYGYLVAYPNGLWRSFNAGSCCGRAAELDVDDVGFIKALVDKINRLYCVDDQRVYGTGFSNGAMLVHRVACERPGLFTAIASVAGTIMLDSCAPHEPTPVLLIRGRADERVPWEGGTVNGSYRRAMEEVVAMIAERNQCGTGARTTLNQGDATCWTRLGCAARLTWCGVAGMGHQWPGGKTIWPLLLGFNTQDYDATARIFAFFEAVGVGSSPDP